MRSFGKFPSGGGAEFGEITGNIADQTDLQNALNAKVNKSDYATSMFFHCVITNLVSNTTYYLTNNYQQGFVTTTGAQNCLSPITGFIFASASHQIISTPSGWSDFNCEIFNLTQNTSDVLYQINFGGIATYTNTSLNFAVTQGDRLYIRFTTTPGTNPTNCFLPTLLLFKY